jgi:hypothetical protein
MRGNEAMKSRQDFWPSVTRAPANLILLCAAVACSLPAARAGSIDIGQINPPGLTAGGITGITFDRGADPLVIDGFGTTVWRLNIQDASVISTFPLTTPEVVTRGLEFAATGQYFTSTRPNASDYLATVNPTVGSVSNIGVMGSFNFLDLASDPITGDLWMVNDCRNIACTSIQGGSLWKVDTSTGAAAPVLTFSASLGQLTAFAISPGGQFFVASAPATVSSSPIIYEINPITGKSILITDTGLAPLSFVTDMAFDPSTNLLYAIQELSDSRGRTWNLDEITGLPTAVPEPGSATCLVIGLGLLSAIIWRRKLRGIGQPDSGSDRN